MMRWFSLRSRRQRVLTVLLALAVLAVMGAIWEATRPTSSNVENGPGGLGTGPISVASTPDPTCRPGQEGCVLPGDGGLLAAINVDRKYAGVRAVVKGGEQSQAQACALSGGQRKDCTSHFVALQTPDKSAAELLGPSLALFPGWDTNPQMTAVSIAWAYFPKSATWQCAIVITLRTTA